jgi:hypothetical protein
MQKIIRHFLSALLLVPAVFLSFSNCGRESTGLEEFASHDTVYYTVEKQLMIYSDSVLYMLLYKRADGGFDTTWSKERFSTDEISIIDTFMYWHVNPLGPLYLIHDTIISVVSHPQALDTVFIYDTLIDTLTLYDTVQTLLAVPFDSIPFFFHTHPPGFSNKDLLAGLLGEIPEGYFRRIEISGYHYFGDRVQIGFLNKPAWANVRWWPSFVILYNGRVYSRCNPDSVYPNPQRLIPKPCNGPWGCEVISRPYLEIFSDSTQVDSTYTWGLIISNKYGLSDTVSFFSHVQRDSCML